VKLLFFGTPEWAIPALVALSASRHRVLAVVTAPDAPRGRSRTPRPPPVKTSAVALGLGPVLQPPTLKGEAVRQELLAFEPEALVVVAYGRILPGRLLDAPRYGGINLHFSLLPRHRGASPVQHTLWAGDAVAGVSTMRMERGLDTGPVYLAASTPLGPEEDAASLGARLAAIGAPLLMQTLDRIESGGIVPEPQDERRATLAPPLTREMGRIDWNGSAQEIARRVRAFVPWPPVVTAGPRGTLRLLRAEPLAQTAPPGTAVGTVLRRSGESVEIACGDGVLSVAELQPEGARPMRGASALAGRYLQVGGRLGHWDSR